MGMIMEEDLFIQLSLSHLSTNSCQVAPTGFCQILSINTILRCTEWIPVGECLAGVPLFWDCNEKCLRFKCVYTVFYMGRFA